MSHSPASSDIALGTMNGPPRYFLHSAGIGDLPHPMSSLVKQHHTLLKEKPAYDSGNMGETTRNTTLAATPQYQQPNMVDGSYNTIQIPAAFKTQDNVNVQLPFPNYEADCTNSATVMKEQYFCQFPGYSELYASMSHLKNHLKHHDEERTDAIRTQGAENVQRPSNYQAVSKDRETIKKKKYVCHIPSCTKDFTKMVRLKDHLQWHAGERRYVCHWHLCNKAFTCEQNLKRHWRIHTGEKPYQCKKCGKRFMRNDYLKAHSESYESQQMQPLFVCPWDLCKKEFTVNASLNRHLRSHTSVRPYQCVVCDKHFMWPEQLNQHMKTHKDQKKTAASISLDSNSFLAPPD